MINLFNEETTDIDFKNPFLTTQLITYIGNKRALLPFLNYGFEKIKAKLSKQRLSVFDGFAGSGVVSRLLKEHCNILYANDLEHYSYICNKCFLSNRSEISPQQINSTIDYLNTQKTSLIDGFITKNYAPKNDYFIQPYERAFYTHKNAMILDTFKKWIFENIPARDQHFYLAPLIVQASIHTNTSGVFKGFHKKNGIGHFGGKGENALKRILGEITLEYPLFSFKECEVNVFQENTNALIKTLPEVDVAYYDPPYNQHPYGSNYFMLNIIAREQLSFSIQNGVSGITTDWNRSDYNKRQAAITAMDDLIKNTNSKYIMLSYNNEGIIPFATLKKLLEKYGNVELLKQKYNTYRGCRNLNNRSTKVDEYLWILKR